MPRRGADRRAGPRYGPAVPFRRRDRPNRKAATVRRSAQRLSALCPLGWGLFPRRRPGAPSPGTMELGVVKHDERQIDRMGRRLLERAMTAED